MTTSDEETRPKPTSPTWVPIAIGALGMLVTIFMLSGPFAIDVLIGLVIDGAIMVAYLASAFGWGSFFARRAPAPLRFVTATAIGLGLMGLVELVLGLAGVLSIYSTLAIITIGLLLLLPLPVLREESRLAVGVRASPTGNLALTPTLSREYTGEGVKTYWGLLPFSIILGLAIVAASMCPGFLWKPLDPHPYDAISYHLQVPREWYDAGRIIPLQHNAFSYFPMLMETHYLAAMHLHGGPWAGMYLCQFMTLAHGLLAVIAVGQIARALGATPLRAWSAAMIVATVPWVFQLSVVAYVETGVMLYTTLAIGWGMIAIRAPSKQAFVIVGLCAGLACGMKYTALVMSAGVVVGLLVVWELSRKRLSNVVIVVGVTALVACPWLVRNVVWTGNPVFPLATSVFGKGHFSDEQVDRYRVAHRPPEREQGVGARMANGWSRTFADEQFGYLALPLGLAAIGVLLLIAPAARREYAFLGLSVLAMVVIWLSATHIMPRFVTPIVPLLAIAIALLPIDGRLTLGLSILQSVSGLVIVWKALAPTLEIGQQGLLRLTDLTALESDEFRAARQSGAPIALVGDAQAFFYPLPSDRLIYRSVFDVRVPAGASLVDGWLGESVESLRARGVWVVINPPELQRLSQTYRHLPALSAPFDQAPPAPIVLPPTGRAPEG